MRTHTVSPTLNPLTGKFQSGFLPTPPQYLLQNGNYYPNPFLKPMRAVYPKPDSVTPPDAHHRVSTAGIPWECPVRVMFGGLYRSATISGLPGAVLSSWFSLDAYGNLIPGNDYLNIIWLNPVVGTYNVVVTVWDGTGDFVTLRWTHISYPVGHASSGTLVGAPAAAGLGDGSSPSDPMAWSNIYLGYNVVGPSKGKTLALLGGFYPAPEYDFNPNFNARNMVNVRGHIPQFSCKFNDRASDRFVGGIEIRDVLITASGLLNTDALYHRLTDYKMRYVNITKSSGANNNSCRFTSGLGGSGFRQDIVSTESYHENCGLMAVESYSVENQLIDRADFKITNLTTMGQHPVWLPKGGIKNCEMSWLRFDNPTVDAFTEGVIKPYCGATDYNTNPADQISNHLVQNCFIRSNGGEGIIAANASNGADKPITAKVYSLRNTVIGAKVWSANYDASSTISRATLFDRMVIQNTRGGIETGGITGGYTVTNSECHGTSGIVDSNGNLAAAYAAYIGQRGWQVRQ
jgi:hypothetical protein